MDQQVIASRFSDVFIFGGSRVSLDGMATLGHVRGRDPTRSVGRDEVGTSSDGTISKLSPTASE